MRLILLLVSFLLVPLVDLPVNAGETRVTCPAQGTDEYYFPPSTLDPHTAKGDRFARDWYSSHLTAMKEPSLSCSPLNDSQSYRFIWLRTFHHPVAVRITHANGQTQLVAVELTGAGGYEPGTIANQIEKQLTPDHWHTLLQGIEKLNFWALPTQEPSSGLDGAQWIIEGRDGSQYHVVDRWAPKSGPYREVGLLFINLTGWSVPPKETY